MRATQLGLFSDPVEAQFVEYHHANPHVYAALVDMARKWASAGHDACSVAMLFEVLRWQTGIRAHGDAFALNNTYRSRYARLIAANEPDLAHLFTMRSLKTDFQHDTTTHERRTA